ncbi:WhiB family transcriptional regulator [Streptomyces sp. NPDC086835]|uniref:WhiB family transcriptional regulator n=1 Tax=Streptomyces sp. NPDC086835 TaxID=3365761 RepID=UPI003808DE15
MHSMTPTQARLARRAVLQTAVDTAAVCTGADPDLFFRGDREPQITWQARRSYAQRLCSACPVRAACEELALRDGDGRPDVDDMVRGGLTGPELAAVRADQGRRVAGAVDADRDVEGRRLDELAVELRRAAVKNPDKAGGHRAQDRAQAAQNAEVRSLVARIRQIRTARRVRAGWEAAA